MPVHSVFSLRLRTVRARKYLKLELASQPQHSLLDEDSMTNATNTSSKAVSDEEEEKEEEEEEKEEEEEMESCDDNSTTGNRSEDVGLECNDMGGGGGGGEGSER